MAESGNTAATFLKILVLVVFAIVAGIIMRLWHHVDLHEEIDTLGMGVVGTLTGWQLGVRPSRPHSTNAATATDTQTTQEAALSQPTVTAEQYNSVVRKHNSLAKALAAQKITIQEAMESRRYLLARLSMTRLHSRALRIAFYLAGFLSFVAFLAGPPQPKDGKDFLTRTAVADIGAFAISFTLSAQLLKEIFIPPKKLALRCGALGCFACGFINCAVGLPYRWVAVKDLETAVPKIQLGSIIVRPHLGPIILMFYLVVLPLSGALGSLAASWWYRSASPQSVLDAREVT
jgi:hypothetical protein